MYVTAIIYDYETRDYAMYIDYELVGFAATYHDAEVALQELILALYGADLEPDQGKETLTKS